MPENLQLMNAPGLGWASVPQNRPAGVPVIGTPSFRWPTPGASLAARLVGKPEVRMVTEHFDGETYGVIVLLTSDPESLLNEIYDAEHQLYTQRWTHPFSLRATCPGGDIEAHARRIASGNIVHYDGRLFG